MNTYRVAFTHDGLPVRYIEADSYEWQPTPHNLDARHATVRFHQECPGNHEGGGHAPARILVAEFNAASVASVEDYRFTQVPEPADGPFWPDAMPENENVITGSETIETEEG